MESNFTGIPRAERGYTCPEYNAKAIGDKSLTQFAHADLGKRAVKQFSPVRIPCETGLAGCLPERMQLIRVGSA